jgi:regulatory protein
VKSSPSDFGPALGSNYGNLVSVPFKRPNLITDEAALYDYAIGALGRRMRNVAELKRLLRRRVANDEAGQMLIQMVVLRLKEQKYLNDANYAAAYSSFRRDNEKFGSRRVMTDLKAKGLHSDVIEKAVAETYSKVDEESQARAFLKRKRLKKPGGDREVAKIFRALRRAGFRQGTAIKILKHWDVEEELLTALQDENSSENSE